MRTHIKLSWWSFPALQWYFRSIFSIFLMLENYTWVFSGVLRKNTYMLYLFWCGVLILVLSMLFSVYWRCVATQNNRLYPHNFSNTMVWLSSLYHILVIPHFSQFTTTTISTIFMATIMELLFWSVVYDGFFPVVIVSLTVYHKLCPYEEMNLTEKYPLHSKCFTNWSLPHLTPFLQASSFPMIQVFKQGQLMNL